MNDPEHLEWQIVGAIAVGGGILGGLVGLMGVERQRGCTHSLISVGAGLSGGATVGLLLATPWSLLVVAVGAVILVAYAVWVRSHMERDEE